MSTRGHCAATAASLTVNDYFRIVRIADLALSQDASKVVYSLERRDLKNNIIEKRIVIQATSPRSSPVYIGELQRGKNFTWIPEKAELAFIMEKEGVNQIFSINVITRTIQQITSSKTSIRDFSFSPDGESIAWISERAKSRTTASLFKRMTEGSSGVVVPAMSTNMLHFIGDYYPDLTITYENELWLRGLAHKPTRINVPGYVRRVNWSSDGLYLSIEFLESMAANQETGRHLINLGLLDLSKHEFTLIAKARRSGRNRNAVWFEGGEWIPGTHSLLIRRFSNQHPLTNKINPWVGARFPSIAAINVETNLSMKSASASWHRTEVRPETKFFPVSDDTIIVSNIVDGVRTVYAWNLSDLSSTNLFDVRGDIREVSFASDFVSAAFVNESFERPPEILFSDDRGNIRQISKVNGDTAQKWGPTVRKFEWESTSGATAYGWLMRPGRYEGNPDAPYPMITYVHGGPASPITNGYAGQLLRWPYPFELLAQSGIAIFLPNYRGTASYGVDYLAEYVDKEPVEDILSGIRRLVDLGIADENCLGIVGHSHGVWLGSLAMTKRHAFRVASFAEGTANYMVNYALMTGSLNHRVHDPLFVGGGSLYENPSRGIEISAVYHFQGLDTAVMFEAGFKSLAIAMLDHQKSALFFGMPSEFVVYPRTGHSVTEPSLQYEVANRNLDWFRFWLLGYEDRGSQKAGQYARWRRMRDADADARCRHARVE